MRKPLSVSCSTSQKEQIFKLFPQPRKRSQQILKILENAIALNKIDYSKESYSHNTTTQFQISCTSSQLDRINNYCDRFLPKFKKSRWIIQQVLTI